jgi:NAD(P)-dependent dehydrogenase (short-subunit alcohol dehydrogenase family)
MAGAPSRRILVTGVGRGLGRALACRFAEAGHLALGCARTEQATASLGSELGPPHEFASVDVGDDIAVSTWIGSLIRRHGAPDLVINNAAIINRNARLWEVPTGEMADLMRINVVGVVNVIRHSVHPLIAAGRGVIVNMSSGWGRSTAPEVAPYCASKWAIEGLTRALSQELPHGLAAVALNPGIIDTAMLRSCFGASAAHYPDAEVWSRTAAPFLLGLGRADNGKSLSVPSR